MKLAVVTLGSAGDLHPFLAIAREMARRGHDVRLLTQEPHRAEVEREGVAFVPIVSERDHVRTLQHPGLWDPIGGFGVLWRHLCVPAIEPCFDALTAWVREDERPLTVFSSPLAVGARFAREALPIRLLTGYTAPSALRSCRDPMFLGAWEVPPWIPRFARRALWTGLDMWKLEPMVRARFEQYRRKWGLEASTQSTFGEWIHGPDGGIGLFPDWFADAADDWPVQPDLVGFPVFEPAIAQGEDRTEDFRLDEFIQAGTPPVVVNAGSAAFGAARFLSLAVNACRGLERRCVVLSPYVDQWPAPVDTTGAVLCVPRARLSGLLPHAAALIHHGGVGTCAQAFAARVPQVILPSAYDQFDNGARVASAGCGISLPGNRERNLASLQGHLELLLKRKVTPALPESGPARRLDQRSPRSRCRASPSFANAPNEAVTRACEFLDS